MQVLYVDNQRSRTVIWIYLYLGIGFMILI